MRTACLMALMLAADGALANPIVVRSLSLYKERALVSIAAEREYAKVAGSFQYRGDRGLPASSGEFSFAVPVFVPREGYGPLSQKEMWSPHSNPQKALGVAVNLQWAMGGSFQTMRDCRVAGTAQLRVPLPPGIASSADTVMCHDSAPIMAREAAEGVRLDLEYRQYYVRARASSRMHLIYLPLFESRAGTQIDTAGRPDDFLVEVRAVSGVTLRLLSSNRIVTNSSALIRVVPAHQEPIVVEVR